MRVLRYVFCRLPISFLPYNIKNQTLIKTFDYILTCNSLEFTLQDDL